MRWNIAHEIIKSNNTYITNILETKNKGGAAWERNFICWSVIWNGETKYEYWLGYDLRCAVDECEIITHSTDENKNGKNIP